MATESLGLNERALGFWDLLLQSVSQISPIGAMIANMTAIAAYAGSLMPMTFMFAGVAFVFLLVILIQFSGRVVSAGGFYGYARAGLGERWGSRTGWLMVITYFMVVSFFSLFIAGVLIPQTIVYFFGVQIPGWTWIPLLIIIQGLIWGTAYLSIKGSLRYSLVTMTVGVVTMAVAAIAIIIHAGHKNDPALFFNFGALHGSKLSGVGVGIIFAMLSLGGASSAIYLSEETPTPKKTVTRAVIWAFAICTFLFLLSSYALTVGWGPTQMSTFAKASLPGIDLTRAAMGPIMAGLLVFFAFNAGFTGSLAPANAVARIVFAMARDQQIFPKQLSYVHPVHRTPTRAISFLGVGSLSVGIIAGLALGPLTGFAILAITATVAHFTAHILVNISLPVYSAKEKRLSVIKHILPSAVASILILMAFYLIMFPIRFPVEWGPIAVIALLLIGEWRLRHPADVRVPADATLAVKDLV